MDEGESRTHFLAFCGEAALIAEQFSLGATALGKANYAQYGHYFQAFFAPSIGIERACKLAILIDVALSNNGKFPGVDVPLRYKHNLNGLLEQADEIAARRPHDGQYRLPRTEIHRSLIEVLSDFARNITRYYNIDVITGNPRTVGVDDPIKAWHERVARPILKSHVRRRSIEHVKAKAQLIGTLIGSFSLVRHHTESGDDLDSMQEASERTGLKKLTAPYERLHVLQIVRFLGELLGDLAHAAHEKRMETVPFLSEFFAKFYNNDRYLKRRKTW